MKTLLFVVILFSGYFPVCGQNETVITGTIRDFQGTNISFAEVSLLGSTAHIPTNEQGYFEIRSTWQGNQVLVIEANNYATQSIALMLESKPLALGIIRLQRLLPIANTDNIVSLTDSDLSGDGESPEAAVGLLQATKDVYLRKAAFDFGQAFFRVRGYDSSEGVLRINGISMNKLLNGRPEWNNWGGLNDVTRTQEHRHGLRSSRYGFGGVLGSTDFDLRPSKMRPGTRFSVSASNRTYSGRIMATHTSAPSNGLAFTVSVSHRSGNQGYIDGTLFGGFSFFSALEWEFKNRHSLSISGILAHTRRGRSAAVTDEVFDLAGRAYNPNWGLQDGKIRNARERFIFEPIVMANYRYRSKNFELTTGVAYQIGSRRNSRLGFFNAPNPDPTFYRYLPSFYINNPIGADFTNAALAREGFRNNPQLDWERIHQANRTPLNDGQASYVLYDDTVDDTQLTAGMVANFRFGESLSMDFGAEIKQLTSSNFAKIRDLLGGVFHADVDAFSNTRNDTEGDVQKGQGERFNYDYDIEGFSSRFFAQLHYGVSRWQVALTVGFRNQSLSRIGKFRNERFLDDSLGESEPIDHSGLQLKGGFTYRISGRHWFSFRGAHTERPPLLQNAFVNPREQNEIVPGLQSETVNALEVGYDMRLPKLTGRIGAYHTRFQNRTDINFFFVDSGLGSDFVQEVLTDLDQLHRGIEFGFEYALSPQVKLTLAGNLGSYVFASNPNVTINFDTASAQEDLIDPEGSIALGNAKIKGLHLAQGPEQAYAIGLSYLDPSYWWIGATANHLKRSYVGLSTITRTSSFALDPETSTPFPEATPENIAALLNQNPLGDFYLLNMVGGKSWLRKGKYISLFISLNNIFDTVYKTGGFEQSRNGNFGQLQQDLLRDNPSFAPRFWYGFGRTFFINFAVSL
ncbi:TonB-dependent receptor [Flagellimonas sp. DF-77]|uniref:carboxypeptidase regulatory-like domain-containing protein n=1 Tax=Flagellimonas algarum TaxID=3230298 RepID=UPI0033981030